MAEPTPQEGSSEGEAFDRSRPETCVVSVTAGSRLRLKALDLDAGSNHRGEATEQPQQQKPHEA